VLHVLNHQIHQIYDTEVLIMKNIYTIKIKATRARSPIEEVEILPLLVMTSRSPTTFLW